MLALGCGMGTLVLMARRRHPDTPSHGHVRPMTTLESLLTTNDWKHIAPTERYMSVIGTIALYTLTRSD